MSDATEDEVIAASPSSVPLQRSQRSQKRKLSHRHSRRRLTSSYVESPVASSSAQKDPKSQNIVPPPEELPEEPPAAIQNAPKQKYLNPWVALLHGDYSAEEEAQWKTGAPESTLTWMESPEMRVQRPPVKNQSLHHNLPYFASLSQFVCMEKENKSENDKEFFAKLLSDDTEAIRDISTQAEEYQRSPLSKKLKVSTPNSPEKCYTDTENLLMSSDDEVDLNKTVILSMEFVKSPVIRGNIDVLSKSFEDDAETTQKSTSQKRISLQTKQHFADVQVASQSFLNVQGTPIVSSKNPITIGKEISDYTPSPTCSKKFSAPKRLFKEAFHPPKDLPKKPPLFHSTPPEDLVKELPPKVPPDFPKTSPQNQAINTPISFGPPQNNPSENPIVFNGFPQEVPGNPQPQMGFRTANKKNITVSEASKKRIQSIFADIGGCVPLNGPGFQTVSFPKPTNVPEVKDNPQAQMGFRTANKKNITVSEETKKRIQSIFADIGGCVPLSGPGFQTVSFNRPPPVPEVKENPQQEECIAKKEDADSDDISPTIPTNFFDYEFTQYVEKPQENPPSQIYDIPEDVRLAREAATNAQNKVIAAKSKDYPQNFKSEQLQRKLSSKRTNLKEFVSGTLPAKASEHHNSSAMNWEESLSVEFDLTAEEQVDHFNVIPNMRNKVGFREISRSLLASRGINPNNIPEDWMENAWKFTVTKFAAMEAAFPDHFAGETLTLRNILHQLHYRYYREIFLGDKPCLRKITELEEPPQKTLVLFVLDIGSGRITLSDGWYKIAAKFDGALEEKVKEGKITIGTKLIAQGCELLNCDREYSPLDVPPSVYLQLHANATRRCRWYAKLGFYHQTQPHTINLDTVLHNGGHIPQLLVRIIRVYPVIYIDTTNRNTIVRSERAEKRFCAKISRNFDNFENIYNEVIEEFAKHEQKPQTPIRNITNITSVRDPAELCNLVKCGYDPESVENNMTGTQKEMLNDYMIKVQDKQRQEINDCIQKRLRMQRMNRRVKQLLQIRVVDAKKPGKSAIINFTTAPEEMMTLLKEGNVYEFTNCNAREVRNSDIIIDGPPAEEVEGNIRKLNGNLFPHEAVYERRVTAFHELPTRDKPDFGEFDVVGIVVGIENMQYQKQEQVFLADGEKNMIRISFFRGLSSFALEDIVIPGAVLCFTNLQWNINSLLSNNVPQLAASEVTNASINPKYPTHHKALEDLRQIFACCNIEDFVHECKQNIP